jgi:hypothetical protein
MLIFRSMALTRLFAVNQLPSGAERRSLRTSIALQNAVIGGWEVSQIATFRSGLAIDGKPTSLAINSVSNGFVFSIPDERQGTDLQLQ